MKISNLKEEQIAFALKQALSIRTAQPHEAEALTHLTLVSKRFWGYSEEQLRRWEPQLTITEDYIRKNDVLVAHSHDVLCGYAALIREPESEMISIGGRTIRGGVYLDNLFVLPEYMQQGFGRALTEEILRVCRTRGIGRIYIVSDPNARAFYEHMGAVLLGETPGSEIARALPFLELAIDPASNAFRDQT
ncbi:MAG: GNAT family N-acetyltransferase [Petrimonas sp.]|nr:GNAT family N-acetyltransferase [Petrimonas sp.]